MKLSPHELIKPFSKTRIWQFVVIAIVAHLILIGITSIGYIKRSITGEPPAVAEAPAEAVPARTPASSPKVEGASPTATSTKAGSPEAQHDALMEQHKDTQVMKDITEVAKPEDIPTEPDPLGISIDDTNGK